MLEKEHTISYSIPLTDELRKAIEEGNVEVSMVECDDVDSASR